MKKKFYTIIICLSLNIFIFDGCSVIQDDNSNIITTTSQDQELSTSYLDTIIEDTVSTEVISAFDPHDSLEQFLNGETPCSIEPGIEYYINDFLDEYAENQLECIVFADFDNDGFDELCIPSFDWYYHVILDANENGVYLFESGDGTGGVLSAYIINNEIWISFGNGSHEGYEMFNFVKINHEKETVEEIKLYKEFSDTDNIHYYLNSAETDEKTYSELLDQYTHNSVFY